MSEGEGGISAALSTKEGNGARVIERHDLLGEVEAELERALLELRVTIDRISALAELRGATVARTLSRGRPATTQDLLAAAPDDAVRARILLLLRRLRGERGRY